MTRTLAVASPDNGLPVRPSMTCALLTNSPSPTPAPTASSRTIVRVELPKLRPFHTSWRPATVGSAGRPSSRADLGTYRKPAGKRSTTCSPCRDAPSALLIVMVYGTSCPRVTLSDGVVL